MSGKHLEVAVENVAGQEIAGMLQLAMAQRTKGLAKYGVSIEESNCTVEELVQHAREEMVDGAVYLGRLLHMHEAALRDARKEAVCNMLRELTGMIESVKDNALDFQLLAVKQFIDSYATATRCPVVMTMFVQPSEFEAFNQNGHNLLTLSRSGHFPFNQKVEVRL